MAPSPPREYALPDMNSPVQPGPNGNSALKSQVSAEAPPAPSLPPGSVPPRRVLIVEDSPIVSERLVALINRERLGFIVSTAAEGHEALRIFRAERPEAVVLDIALPGLNGFDLLREFKQRQPGCVVIILTTYAYTEFRENAARLGADYFFSKAMEFEMVSKVLRTLVAPPRPLPS